MFLLLLLMATSACACHLCRLRAEPVQHRSTEQHRTAQNRAVLCRAGEQSLRGGMHTAHVEDRAIRVVVTQDGHRQTAYRE